MPITTTSPLGTRQRASPPLEAADDDADKGGLSQPNEACRLLFGPNTKAAPIDAGFKSHTPFQHGDVVVFHGAKGRIDLDHVNLSLGPGQNTPLSSAPPRRASASCTWPTSAH